jgi:hypothetical protein
MKVTSNNDCFIDVISKEAIIKNLQKLKKAKIKTIPYATTLLNTLTGETIGHAEMVFHYNGDTWHYSNHQGSIKVYPKNLSEDILSVSEKVYSLTPHMKVLKVIPMDLVANFPEHSQPLSEQYYRK